jgi:hypothetical protein
MSELLDQFGQPIGAKAAPLPAVEQILQDPITKKFLFLHSKEDPDVTCIGLTDETDYSGTIYKYGAVKIPDESKIVDGEPLRLEFKYDIIENNGYPKEKFGDDFFKLIGDILFHIIITQSEDGSIDEPNNRTDSTQ